MIDVLIAGAGPAGALAARLLARRGLKVVLVDKSSFPREKVCGTCLNQNSLGVLESVGLGDLIERLGGVPLSGFHLGGWHRSASIELPIGRSVSRSVLDSAIVHEAIAAGAEFRPQTRATLGPLVGESREVRLNDTPVFTRIVIDASGLNGLDAPEFAHKIVNGSRIGVGVTTDSVTGFAPGVIHMAIGDGGYVGAVQQEDGRLNLAAALDPATMRTHRGPGSMVASLLASADFPIPPDVEKLDWRGTLPLTRRSVPRAIARVFRIGDAAAYVEPFTGEGMAWAFAGAVAIAPIVVDAMPAWSPMFAKRWESTHQRMIAQRQNVCRWLAMMLHRPILARTMLFALRTFPAVSRPFVRHLNRPPRSLYENAP